MKNCFIICPIGESDSEIRRRADKVLKHILNPVLEKYSYNAIRADKIPKAGIITTQIINLLIDAELVIADLTGGNPNVFYELAIRHASRKPFIQILDKGEKIPFDVYGVRNIDIDLSDPDNIESAKKELENQIKEVENGHIPDSLISIATNVKILQSDSEITEKLLEKLESLSDNNFNSIDDVADKIEDLQSTLQDFLENIGLSEVKNRKNEVLKKLSLLTGYGWTSIDDVVVKLEKGFQDLRLLIDNQNKNNR
jgi:hypothetical protein